MRGGRWLRGLGITAALVLPPVGLALAVWPDDGRGGVGRDGEAFGEPVTGVHTARIELDGVTYDATLRADPMGACFEVSGPQSGSGTCGALAGLRDGADGISTSSDPAGTELLLAALVGPEVADIELAFDDGTTVPGVVVELPDRPERVAVAVARVDGQMPAGGVPLPSARFLDAEGDEVDPSAP